MTLLYGIHDTEGQHLVPGGGACLHLVSLSEDPSPKHYNRADIRHWVRVNWGYGSTGTIPQPDKLTDYMSALSAFVGRSRGIYGIIVGNEPNHEQERPNGMVITPEYYAQVYKQVHHLVKNQSSNIRLAPAAPAPYLADWRDWWVNALHAILPLKPDYLTIHAYLREHNRDSVHDVRTMDAPLAGLFYGFFTYRDALQVVPKPLSHLPVLLTEVNPVNGWEDKNDGTVKRIYQEIDWWNKQSGTQKIEHVFLYRYPGHDEGEKWAFYNKAGVIEDFREAVALSLESPQNAQEGRSDDLTTTLMPSIKKGVSNAPGPSTGFSRQIDQRAVARGVSWTEVPSGTAWRVKKIQWFNEEEADRIGPDHHFLFDTLDENGNRLTGVNIKVIWPTGFHTVTSEAKPGELASANYPMSPSRNDFSALVVDTAPSEMVRGVGMGSDTPGGFNDGTHTTTLVVFQRGSVQQDSPPVSEGKGGNDMPELVHPVQNPALRRISQVFGVNESYYKQFVYDGVPLRGHNGIDFATPVGSIIVAADAGKVIEQEFDADGYGIYVKMQHAWGETLYAHLFDEMVAVGDVLKRGEPLGKSGNTGKSTGPHLHFGLRIFPYRRNDGWGGYKDPLLYLKQSSEMPVAPIQSTSHAVITKIIKQVAQEQKMDWRLLASMAWAESSFRPELKYGLFQVEDSAWNDWSGSVGATNRHDALDNARVGARYLRWLIERYPGNIYKALLAYNFGVGNVDAGREAPQISKEYVNKVAHGYDLLRAVGN